MLDSKYNANKNCMRIGGLLLCTVLLTACALPLSSGVKAPQMTSDDDFSYLRSGDKLSFSIYGEDSISRNLIVDSRGYLKLPMIGRVDVKGKNLQELEQVIGTKYAQRGYFVNPEVNLDIVDNRGVYILGEVNKPGKYTFDPDLITLQSVSVAGGYTPRASEGDFIIERKVNGKFLRLDGDNRTPLLPGDTVIVRERIF